MQVKMNDMKLKAQISDKQKLNSLLIGILADDATKRGDNSEQIKGLEEIFEILDQRKKDVEEGNNSLEFTKDEMNKIVKSLDFMRKMTEEKRRKFAERLKEIIENFEANTDGIMQETINQIKILKSYIDEVNLSLGSIQVLNSLIKEKEYDKKNSVLIDMLQFGKGDPEFTNQVEEAAPETRALVNELIKSLEEDNKARESQRGGSQCNKSE